VSRERYQVGEHLRHSDGGLWIVTDISGGYYTIDRLDIEGETGGMIFDEVHYNDLHGAAWVSEGFGRTRAVGALAEREGQG
jgi:hypothetical protein